ncbi:MAG: hypothetical protein NWE84_05720 [Candidatus Bathyarchaeota archaeon]|nr:hypothetical protein [Candidatus Bathyarchaeota archaeon]
MQKKIKISIATLAALMLAILAVNLVMGATTAVNTLAPSPNNLEAIEKLDPEGGIIISPEQVENKEQLKELAPATPEDAEESIYPVRRRFLLWTNDGIHIMWGIYGNGRFVGTDNLGKRCWGIYGKGIFAGFYDAEFFWGKYCNGSWKAEYLFGLDYSRGIYVLFPPPAIANDLTVSP